MKTLVYDIECAPNLSYVWDHYETNVIKHVEEWYVLCVAYMWLDDTSPDCVALPEFNSEKDMLAVVWELLNAADIVVAHNGNKFDMRKLNARFLQLGMKPPSPVQQIDTLRVARSKFKFNQNGLDPLGQHLGLGSKAKHQGFELWERCMNDEYDEVAWRKMVRYAKRDVVLLKKLYLQLRPWIDNHPNVMVERGGHGCPACGSDKLQSRGKARTKTMTYRRWQCQKCGKWSRSRLAEKTLDRPEQV